MEVLDDLQMPKADQPVAQADQVYARSTNYQRTVATLQGILTGLYPSTQEAIPVETAQDVDEILFANAGSCERLRQLLSQARDRVRGELLH